MDFALMATIQAVVVVVIGTAFLVVPRVWVSPFGTVMHADGEWFGRLLGATLLGFAVLSWVGRETADELAQQAIAWGSLVANGIAAPLHVPRVAGAEILNARGWAIFALLAAIAIGWVAVIVS